MKPGSNEYVRRGKVLPEVRENLENIWNFVTKLEETYKFKEFWRIFTMKMAKKVFGNFLSFEKAVPWKLPKVSPQGCATCATLLRCGLISSPCFGRNNDLPNLAGQARGKYKPYKCVSMRVSVRLSRQPYQKSWTAEDLLEEVHTKDLLKEVHANA